MLPIVARSLVNASTSCPAWKPAPICTVAAASVALSRSVTAMPVSIATGVDAALSAATNAALPVLLVDSSGVCSVGVTTMVRVSALLNCEPALSEKLTVRVASFGVTCVSL